MYVYEGETPRRERCAYVCVCEEEVPRRGGVHMCVYVKEKCPGEEGDILSGCVEVPRLHITTSQRRVQARCLCCQGES